MGSAAGTQGLTLSKPRPAAFRARLLRQALPRASAARPGSNLQLAQLSLPSFKFPKQIWGYLLPAPKHSAAGLLPMAGPVFNYTLSPALPAVIKFAEDINRFLFTRAGRGQKGLFSCGSPSPRCEARGFTASGRLGRGRVEPAPSQAPQTGPTRLPGHAGSHSRSPHFGLLLPILCPHGDCQGLRLVSRWMPGPDPGQPRPAKPG